MHIALFTPKENFITITKKINSAVDDFIFVDQFDTPIQLIKSITNLIYDALWVPTDGAKGMEMVILLKRHFPDIPLIWESEDKKFALIAYELQVPYFLANDSNLGEISNIFERMGTRCSHEYSVVL